jgi:hypothetical protein
MKRKRPQEKAPVVKKRKREQERRDVERFESEGGNPGPPGASRLTGPREDTDATVRPSQPGTSAR